ncbi:hypothetical protein Dda_7646 [Drechslerella dactyloides]|uniref:Uncharacterized protein n=1 Tax=Drechslerella dactyloides TaxID=74499 RepID=A0AAD6NH12_DREDA|nr:hypothetical protein Dda_7646 [Drechslerella dactyloides]
MSNGPLPAAVHLLQNVRYLPVGSKVRVLGCIHHYDAASGTIVLHHRPSIDVPLPKVHIHAHRPAARRPTTYYPTPDGTDTGTGDIPHPPTKNITVQAPPPTPQNSPAPTSSQTYTLTVSIDLLLQCEVNERTKEMPRLPPLQELGTWVMVTGYTTAEGGVQAIAMGVENKVNVEAYEKGVAALAMARERAEGIVAGGRAEGAAVSEGQWGWH